MSLVGTRPPTVDEWELYEPHHRARMSFRPGLTGMWQVSGRSNITDLVCLRLQYSMGMSVFSYYIKFNGICNLYDINIEAESFIGDICRILYGWDLRNENSVFQNNAGYDLISEKDNRKPLV